MADKKVRIGFIGFGGIAQGAHMPGYKKIAELCDVVAVADILPEKLATAQEKWQIPDVYEDYHKLLEREDIDAVSVCTPNAVHMPATVDALKAGKHVLCEKPMAMNPVECEAMIAAQKASGKKIANRLQYALRVGSAVPETGGHRRGVWRHLLLPRSRHSTAAGPCVPELPGQKAQRRRPAD